MELRLLGVALAAMLVVYLVLVGTPRRRSQTADDGGPDDDHAPTRVLLWEIAVTSVVVGVFAGRLAAMIGNGVNPLTNPRDILIVRAGVATGWATAATIVTAAWLARRSPLATLDALAPAALLGLAAWGGGCVVRGSCLGTPSELPWAIHQTGSPVGRHPVELYAALAFLVVGSVLTWWSSRSRWAPGMLAATALATAGSVRLVTEPLRLSLAGGPVWWYIAAIVAGLGSAAVVGRRPRPEASATGRGVFV